MPITAASDAVRVAVGILADRDRVFVTRRPPNAHQGGKWEFPGGKLDRGESALAALRRELHEELGVDVQHARPLMQIRHAYPDKDVLLDVWSVTAYSGIPHGREGQEARWVSRSDMLALDFPAADLPIQRRLWLPALYAISDCTRFGLTFLDRLDMALAGGLRLLQLREPALNGDAYIILARDVVARCHGHGAKVLLNADPALVEEIGADGVHLNSRRLMHTRTRPPQSNFVVASCHDEIELARAAEIGADAVVLGPVAATRSHPDATPMGWDRFAESCRLAVPAVYALGGMRPDLLAQAQRLGAHGLAMMSGVWEAPDIRAAVAACEVDNEVHVGRISEAQSDTTALPR